ncbi:MAG: aminotransferase class V-fold PLP-dependent enzyme, partial [Clostridiaceae bacterium]
NVTGYINPIYKLAELAHRYGAKIHVDAAQLVSHQCIDMKPSESNQHIDFISFSAHKMYAPFGSGVLIGAKADFNYGMPYAQGGSAINLVTHSKIDWNEPPEKDEAGTPNLMGIVSLLTSIKTFASVGIENISRYEKKLYSYAYSELKTVPDLIIYSKYQDSGSVGIIPFNMKAINHNLLSDILSKEAGIAVRSGFFCAHPYCQRLLGYTEKDMDYYFENKDSDLPGLTRISLGLYNTYEEIDILIQTLKFISENKNYYIKKYENL